MQDDELPRAVSPVERRCDFTRGVLIR